MAQIGDNILESMGVVLQMLYILFFSFFFLQFVAFCFIYFLFLAALGLFCCTRAFSSCSEQGYSSLQCAGFSLRWLLLLRSTGSRHAGSVVVARRL